MAYYEVLAVKVSTLKEQWWNLTLRPELKSTLVLRTLASDEGCSYQISTASSVSTSAATVAHRALPVAL